MKSFLVLAVLACIANVGFMAPTAATPKHINPTPAAPTKHVDPVTAAPTKHVDPHTAAPTTKHVDPATHAPTTKHVNPVTATPTKHVDPVTHAPPTTKSPVVPVTKAPPHVDHRDEKLSNLSHQVINISKEVTQIDKAFEISAALGHTADLAKLLDIIKQVKLQVQVADVDIKLEIASDFGSLRTYGRRLSLEMLRIAVEKYDKFLTAVGQEIMGSFGELNKIGNYQTSETISIALQLLQVRFASITHNINEVDKLIQDAYQKDPLQPKIDAATKQKVDKDLEDIVKAASSAKQEISKDYYDEVERIRLENREMNLWQKFEFETFIDMINYSIEYTKKFEELFNRINN